MSEPTSTPAEAVATDLQFDRAQFVDPAAATLTCAGCQQPIDGTYFEVNGQTTCAGCRTAIPEMQGGAGASGLLKATAGGVAAGILGALIYYAVAALTGYEFGLIAIVVGVMVGRAVRWGSSGRGGRLYQALAIVLTYLSIVGSYAPFVWKGLIEADAQQHSGAATTGGAADTGESSAARRGEVPAGNITAGDLAIAVLVFSAIVLAAPFLGGISNILGLLILAFGLYEAWKVNKRATFEISGPFFSRRPAIEALPSA
jgi:hypothetical protein